MSEIQSACRLHPERCVIGHPFNPPHLVPLVEIVGGTLTSEATIQRADRILHGVGQADRPACARKCRAMSPIACRRRWRARSIIWSPTTSSSVADVDKALSWGPGLRWGIMGQVLLNHLGGGQGGIEHFFEQFTGPMTAWWKVLGSPELTPKCGAS